jgi:hypothetical protein
MEAKFCPQCGNPRVGNFCGKCGFNFSAHSSLQAGPVASATDDKQGELSTRQLPKGLIRGESFNAKSHCDNCGLKLNKQSKCEECGE